MEEEALDRDRVAGCVLIDQTDPLLLRRRHRIATSEHNSETETFLLLLLLLLLLLQFDQTEK